MKKKAANFLFLAIVAVTILFMFSVASCTEKPETHIETAMNRTITFSLHWGDVERFVDSDAGVVCWIYTGNVSTRGSIDCLPISQTTLP